MQLVKRVLQKFGVYHLGSLNLGINPLMFILYSNAIYVVFWMLDYEYDACA